MKGTKIIYLRRKVFAAAAFAIAAVMMFWVDRKSTRLNSSHQF